MRVLRPTTWAGRLDKIMATRKRHSPEQIVRKLMAADRLLSEGKDTAAVCRELGVSEATYHRWRNQFGGLKAEDAKRLKDLERENSTLKRLLADAELEKAALKEIAREILGPQRRRAAVRHLRHTLLVALQTLALTTAKPALVLPCPATSPGAARAAVTPA